MVAPTSIMVVTGEASSDHHAATLVRELKSIVPTVELFGMGGGCLEQEGVEILVDIRTHGSIMGLIEVLSSLGKIVSAYKKLVREAKARKPAAVILVDYPDFNLRLAKDLHKLGIKVFYYITPQIWAWRKGRAKIIKKYVDKVVPIFPFEEKFYRELGIDASFVGHPFLADSTPSCSREEFLAKAGVPTGKKIVALLPGSRRAEVEKLVGPMLEALVLLKQRGYEVEGLLPLAPTVKDDWLEPYKELLASCFVVRGQAKEVLASSDAGIIASGTATVEALLSGLPFCVVYKMNALTLKVGRLIVKGIQNFAMPNIIAGKEIVTELLQEQVTPERMADEVQKLLYDEQHRKQTITELQRARDALEYRGSEAGTPAHRAAELLLECIK